MGSRRVFHVREADIQRAILDWLRVNGIYAFRNNQQGVPLHDGSGRYRPSPTRGVADILGVIPGGRFLAVEVKGRRGKPTPQQAEFIARVNEKGGLAVVATCILDVERVLRPYLPANPETELVVCL